MNYTKKGTYVPILIIAFKHRFNRVQDLIPLRKTMRLRRLFGSFNVYYGILNARQWTMAATASHGADIKQSGSPMILSTVHQQTVSLSLLPSLLSVRLCYCLCCQLDTV